jgi:hypothetical protein
MKLYNFINAYQCPRETCRLHRQLNFKMKLLPKRRYVSTKLRGLLSQEMLIVRIFQSCRGKDSFIGVI